MAEAPEHYRSILEQSLGIPFSTGNSIDVLKNGVEIFPSMLSAIKKAKYRIEFLTFVYWSGDIARTFAETLARKAEEGVEVYVILDCFGAAWMPRELSDLMEESGVQIEWFRPLTRWKIWKTDNRTHRKVLICDGKVAFTGGVGIAREWEGDARNPDEWRETHFRIEGPAVYGMQAAFMENWIEAGRELEFDPPGLPETSTESGIAVQVIRTAASVRWSDIVMLYQTLIRMATESIHITTAYFNPNDVMVDLLCDAAGRGVDVQIMVPGRHTDKKVARVAGDECFEKLLDSGVSLWYYQKTMLHAKVITVDGLLCCVGSANFNHRSMMKDDEVNVVIIDPDITGELNAHFEEDLEHCDPVFEHRWRKRSRWKRFKEKFARLFRNEI